MSLSAVEFWIEEVGLISPIQKRRALGKNLNHLKGGRLIVAALVYCFRNAHEINIMSITDHSVKNGNQCLSSNNITPRRAG